MKRRLQLPALLVFLLCCIPASRAQAQYIPPADFHSRWGDSLLRTMSLREQIGQLFMVAAYSNKGPEHTAEIEELISKYRIGGLCFFQGTPLAQIYLTNYYQDISRIPLYIAIDGEWGLAMRLKQVPKLPYQITFGSLQNDSMVYRMGKEVGYQCRRMGIHINFAPVADINSNPANPIIGFRSFGESKGMVMRKTMYYAMAMQEQGIIACAKHFPGHGDTEADSHLELPKLFTDSTTLDTLELYPFRELFDAGIKSTMTAHLWVPAVDSTPNRPGSLSDKMVNGLLKNRMQYKGLIFTDALNMKGVTKYFPPGYAELEAFLAGNDMLVYPENVPLAINLILQAVDSGRTDSITITERVRKILWYKQQSGLDRYQPASSANLLKDLNTPEAAAIVQETSRQSITVVRNTQSILPLYRNSWKRIASVAVGKDASYAFQGELNRFRRADPFTISFEASYGEYSKLFDKLASYDLVIISVHNRNVWGKRGSNLPQTLAQFIYDVRSRSEVVLTLFCNPYVLRSVPKLSTVVCAYEDGTDYQLNTARTLFAEAPAPGHLPVNVTDEYHMGLADHLSNSLTRHLAHVTPESQGMNSAELKKIDLILKKMRQEKAAPGAQVMVLRNGKVVYENNFGNQTYDNTKRIDSFTLYDIASVTKVAATTLAVMKLLDEKKIDLDKTLGYYLPDAQGTNKEDIRLRELMLHEAGLESWIPFYKETLSKRSYWFCTTPTDCYQVKVADSLYADSVIYKWVWQRIWDSPLKERGKYVYSDLSMLLMQQVIEKVSKMPLHLYVHHNFYDPMDLQTTTFLPREKFNAFSIAPTVVDTQFRRQEVRGHVHDPAAALLGGVAGNAGLFSNAEDLSKIFQMLLDKGSFNGKKLIRESTVQTFTSRQSAHSRRGLGFDKPEAGKSNGPTSAYCSASTFGHTGFTGTCVWADPEKNLVYVFLSNRVYPDENNRKLIEGNYRTDIQDIIYKSIIE